jgi:quercetin dioxygenase-like cupin family protein
MMRLTSITRFGCLLVSLAAAGGPAAGQSEDRAAGKERSMMTITRKGSRTSSQGPAQYFTGPVTVEPLFPAHDPPSRVSGALVTFQPGACSAWHRHPLGQALIVTAGTGWVQEEGGEKYEIRAGDVVWTPPGVKHWHGATPNEALTHIALQEQLDGQMVEWLEKVTDEQYRGGKTAGEQE